MAEVTERLLWRALLVFQNRQLVAKVDDELAVSVCLPRRQDHDATQIEIVL